MINNLLYIMIHKNPKTNSFMFLGWTIVEDEEGRLGPYAHQGRNWVGYDDVAMIKYKSEYIRY